MLWAYILFYSCSAAVHRSLMSARGFCQNNLWNLEPLHFGYKSLNIVYFLDRAPRQETSQCYQLRHQIWHPAPTGCQSEVTAPLLCTNRGHLPKSCPLCCLANLLSCTLDHYKAVCTARARKVSGICMLVTSTVALHYSWYSFSLIPMPHIYIYSLGRCSSPFSPVNDFSAQASWFNSPRVCSKNKKKATEFSFTLVNDWRLN